MDFCIESCDRGRHTTLRQRLDAGNRLRRHSPPPYPAAVDVSRSVISSGHEHSAARPGQSAHRSRWGASVDLVATIEHAAGQAGEALGERRLVGRRERARDRLGGALEEAVGDLDARGAVAQGGERVDDPLGRVVALDDLGRLGALEPVGLVVGDQDAAVGLERDDVEEAVDQRPAAGALEREGERRLAAQAARAGQPRAQRRAGEGGHEPADVLDLGLAELEPPGAAELEHGFRAGDGRAREVELLEQRVDERAAHARVERRRRLAARSARGGGVTRGSRSTRSR